MPETPNKSITRDEYYALTGLLVLAGEHNTALQTIFRAAAKITDEPRADLGHTADAIYGTGVSVDELLARLGIEVDA